VNRNRVGRAGLLAVLALFSYWSLDQAWSRRELTAELDPENPDILMQLGQRAEFAGDLPLAERTLLRAAAISRLHQPRYLLAQFYFRHPDGDRFGTWSRAALETESGDAGVLLDLEWRIHPDGQWLWDHAVPRRPEVVRQYLGFLTGKQEWESASVVARYLANHGDSSDLQALLIWCDALLVEGDPTAPRDVWDELCRRKLLPYPGDALITNAVTNADFRHKPLAAGFDWRPTGVAGVTISVDRGLRLAFTGNQPEDCTLIWQYVKCKPGSRYRVDQEPRTDGLAWRLENGRLLLTYHRPLGSTRLADTVTIDAPKLEETR
jgi:hypothetical protein